MSTYIHGKRLIGGQLAIRDLLADCDKFRRHPSEEHHVLNATNVLSVPGEGGLHSLSRSRYVYGTSNARQESPTTMYECHTADAVTLGSVKVDSDIDKLKGIIKSVDRILRRLHHSSMIIEATQSTKNALQIDLLKDIDSFGDSRGGVINQRSLVNGVAALGNSYVSLNKGSRIISDGKATNSRCVVIELCECH